MPGEISEKLTTFSKIIIIHVKLDYISTIKGLVLMLLISILNNSNNGFLDTILIITKFENSNVQFVYF